MLHCEKIMEQELISSKVVSKSVQGIVHYLAYGGISKALVLKEETSFRAKKREE